MRPNYKTPTSFAIIAIAVAIMIYAAAMSNSLTVLAKSDNETNSPSPLPDKGDSGSKDGNNCDNISIIINHKHNDCNSGHSGHKGKSNKSSKGDTGNGDLLRGIEDRKLADPETLASQQQQLEQQKGAIGLQAFGVRVINDTHILINFTTDLGSNYIYTVPKQIPKTMSGVGARIQ